MAIYKLLLGTGRICVPPLALSGPNWPSWAYQKRRIKKKYNDKEQTIRWESNFTRNRFMGHLVFWR